MNICNACIFNWFQHEGFEQQTSKKEMYNLKDYTYTFYEEPFSDFQFQL